MALQPLCISVINNAAESKQYFFICRAETALMNTKT